MAQKFKVGDKVEDFQRGAGEVVNIDSDPGEEYRVDVKIDGYIRCYTLFGKYDLSEKHASLRLTGRPFNVGDRVVIGSEKGVVSFVSKGTSTTPVNVGFNNKDEVWLTTDGRAWPGTPVICEHDWENEAESEETETVSTETGLVDVTVSSAEVRHIAEMQEQLMERVMTEEDFLKDQMPKYIKMALALAGIDVDTETADLIREIVLAVDTDGGVYNLAHHCAIEQRIKEKYATV